MKRLKSLTYPRWLVAVMTLVIPVLAYYLLEALTHNPFEIPFQLQLFGWLFVWLFTAILFFLTGRMNVSLILGTLFQAILGTVNYFVLEFRSSPILPWDIASMKTAVSVADHFSFTPSARLILSLIGFLVLILLSIKVELRLKKHWLIRLGGLTGAAVLSVLYVLCLQNESITDYLDVYEMPFTQDYTYEQNGFYVSFLVNTKYLKVEKPDGYSAKKAQELLDGAREDASVQESASGSTAVASGSPIASGSSSSSQAEEKPNIIVIMNEAFSDLSVIGDFEASEDYLPYFRSLYGSENTISGNLRVSVLGGNTANTEFEFLTGDTMAFLPTGSIPYQQFITGELPALPSLLKSYGYTTTALHPYNSTGWKRDQIYPLLGFEESLFNGDFTYKKRLRGYITDESAFKEVIKAYEEKKENGPFFSFLVTMQNHGGYSKDWTDFTRSITVEGMDDRKLPRINAYLTLLKKTDDAYRELISYFSQCEEKTIVLMFGDHQPNVETSFLEQLYGKDYDDLTEEELSLRYQTPFVLWANYDIDEAEGIDISANYLSSLLMDTAGLKKTAYQDYLTSLREQLPVLTANYCYDAEGNFYSADDFDQVKDLLNDYEILQYNHLFDPKNRAEGFAD